MNGRVPPHSFLHISSSSIACQDMTVALLNNLSHDKAILFDNRSKRRDIALREKRGTRNQKTYPVR